MSAQRRVLLELDDALGIPGHANVFGVDVVDQRSADQLLGGDMCSTVVPTSETVVQPAYPGVSAWALNLPPNANELGIEQVWRIQYRLLRDFVEHGKSIAYWMRDLTT